MNLQARKCQRFAFRGLFYITLPLFFEKAAVLGSKNNIPELLILDSQYKVVRNKKQEGSR